MVEKLSKNLIIVTAIITAIIIAGALIVGAIIFVNQEKVEETIKPEIESPLVNLAKCLSEKGVKFYGTYWCGFCTRQKEMFGEAAKYLPYIECASDRASPEELAMCEKAGVESIPDWRFADGRQELGMLSLEKLAEFSGCQL